MVFTWSTDAECRSEIVENLRKYLTNFNVRIMCSVSHVNIFLNIKKGKLNKVTNLSQNPQSSNLYAAACIASTYSL